MSHDLIKEASNGLVGGSLAILGAVFVLEGGLTWTGLSVFIPMMTGGVGLAFTSLVGILYRVIPTKKWRSVCLSLQKMLPQKMTS